MSKLLAVGLTQLFRGARKGQALTAGLGAALTLVGLAKRYAGKDRELLFARTLKDGEGVTVYMKRGLEDGETG